MSDLNQVVLRVKAGLDVEHYRKLILFLIDKFNGGEGGPICCFYTCKVREVPQELILKDFRNHARSSKDWVIGCSRGCISIQKDNEATRKLYAQKLCKECVEDAKELVEKPKKTK